jgi:HPt (histidine-containing phosphotransfer) domain-containing protein
MSSRPVPQYGRLVPLTLDNYAVATASSSPPPPPLVPIDDSEEKTMLWRNIADLFTKYDDTARTSNDVYQELQDVRADFTENNVLTKHIRKIRKYVNKKCNEVRDNANYSTEGATNEIFSYVDTVRAEIEKRTARLEADIVELNDTYYRDYQMFIRREDDLMAKLNEAVTKNEDMCARMEATFMKKLQQVRNEMEQRFHTMAGDLREEFAHSITKELTFEHDEMVDLVKRSNEIHTHRFFTVAEDVKQVRENCHTLKQSIGMVDAELSDVKETVEHLTDETGQNSTDISDLTEDVKVMKDDMYYELDRDYYDMKDYVKRRINRHEKKSHMKVEVDEHEQLQSQENVAAAVAATAAEPVPPPTEHIIIIDENTVFSDDE